MATTSEKRIPKHGDENMHGVYAIRLWNDNSEKRIPKHGDENASLKTLNTWEIPRVKKESPNMGTKTGHRQTRTLSHRQGEKRIPKHGDENMNLVILSSSSLLM